MGEYYLIILRGAIKVKNSEVKIPINPSYYENKSEFSIRWEETRGEKYKEYRQKWAENPRNFVVGEGPIHLDIEPTNACDLKCPMCPRTILVEKGCNSDNKFHTGFMELSFYKNLIDQAVDMGVYSIKLNWLGEPILHKDIVEMVRYAKEKGIVDVMFNTNAVRLDEEMIKGLVLAGLDKIFFSFDSPIKEKYEQIRVGANYEQTLNNIKNVKRIREELGKDIPLTRVSMVLMQDNKDEYEEFVKLFKDIIDVVGFGYYVNPQEMDEDGKQVENREKVKGFACSQLWQRMFIAWDGEVIVCCQDSNRGYVVGNAHQENLKDIWMNEKYKYIREKHQCGNYNEVEICSKCSLATMEEDGSY